MAEKRKKKYNCLLKKKKRNVEIYGTTTNMATQKTNKKPFLSSWIAVREKQPRWPRGAVRTRRCWTILTGLRRGQSASAL